MVTDLRSDTVTCPTKEMLEAMMLARVGDDVYGEDPAINQLEDKTAAMFGKDAGLFCPSGTMTNQIAIKVHTLPGDEIICDRFAHIYNYEGGGIAFNSGASVRLLNGDRGRLTAFEVEKNINPDNIHNPKTRLVEIENTVNIGGGACYSLAEVIKIANVCKKHKLKFHLDGARLFNALVKTGETTEQYGKLCDSISICLSKGLGAPVGSVLVGNDSFIKQARRIRKVFGGAMRQAGYIAAAGVYALDNHIKRLTEDHGKAGIIAEILEQQPYVANVTPVETNIIIFELNETLRASEFVKVLAEQNIKVSAFGGQLIRMVTHLDIKNDMLTEVEKVLKNTRLFIK